MNPLHERWAVTYQYHTKDEAFACKTLVIEAESITEAINKVDDSLSRLFEYCHWSDYHITNANIIPELH